MLTEVDQAVNTFSRLQQVDPCRLDNMDTYSNLLYVKVSIIIELGNEKTLKSFPLTDNFHRLIRTTAM